MGEARPRRLVTFFRRKRVCGRVYVYELESYRDEAGQPRTRILRYLGPEEPIYRKATGAPQPESRGRSAEERREARELQREDDVVRRWLEKNRR